MKRLFGAALLAGLFAVGLSCGGEPTMSGPGTLRVRLTSPNSGLDSAIVVTITGPAALTSAVPGAGLRLFQQPFGGTSTRFALIGQRPRRAQSVQWHDQRCGNAELHPAHPTGRLRARVDALVAGLGRRVGRVPGARQDLFQPVPQVLIRCE